MFITVSKKSKSGLLARLLFTDLENFSRFLPRSYHSRPQICLEDIVTFVLYTTDVGYKWLNVNFSTGGFKPFTTKSRREKPLSQEVEADTASQAKSAMEDFSCPKEGCVRVFIS